MVTHIRKIPAGRAWDLIKEALTLFGKKPFWWILVSFFPFVFSTAFQFLTKELQHSAFLTLVSFFHYIFYFMLVIGLLNLIMEERKQKEMKFFNIFNLFREPKQFLKLILLNFIYLGGLLLAILFPLSLWLIMGLGTNDIQSTIQLLAIGSFELIPVPILATLSIIIVLIFIFCIIWGATMFMVYPLVGIFHTPIKKALSLGFRANFKNIGFLGNLAGLAILSSLLTILSLGLGLFVFIPTSQIVFAFLIDDMFARQD